MEYITLKNSDLEVSRFCMGGCPMGGYGWGNVQKTELVDAVRTALDNGVNYFDTADTYGLGQSEMTLAEALGADRKRVVIQTKFGVRQGEKGTFYDNSPEYIEEALDASLKRLNTDYIDIYTLHYRDGRTPAEAVVEKLLSLRERGKIRYFGLSNVHESELLEFEKYKGYFVCCQDEYSLACRKNEGDLLRARDELLVTPLTWGSLGQGILTGKYGRDVAFGNNDRRSRDIYVNFHGEKLEKNLCIVDKLKEISERRGKMVAACAIRFILDNISESVVICGVKRPSQVMSNLDAFGWSLTEEELSELREVSSR